MLHQNPVRKNLKATLLADINHYIYVTNPKPEPKPENLSILGKFGFFIEEKARYVSRGFSDEDGNIRAEKYRDKVFMTAYSDNELIAIIYRDILELTNEDRLGSSKKVRGLMVAGLYDYLGGKRDPEYASIEDLTELLFTSLNLNSKDRDARARKLTSSVAVAMGSGMAFGGGVARIHADNLTQVTHTMIKEATQHLMPRSESTVSASIDNSRL